MLPTGVQKPHKNRSAGFTLVEVLVVTLLIVVLATLATPRFQGVVANMRLQNQAKTIGHMVRLAQMRAQTEGVVYRVEINDNGQGVQVMRQRNGERFVPAAQIEKIYVSGELTFEPDLDAMTFSPDGRYTQAMLILSGFNDQVYEIVPTIGRVEVTREK